MKQVPKLSYAAAFVALAGLLFSCREKPAAMETMPAPSADHFDAKGKAPSAATIAKWEALKNKMPFEDVRDFEEQEKGFIAKPDYTQIMADAGHVAWDMGRYSFLLEGKDFQSIHPSLQRMAILNMNYGLYKVMDGIYQIRGYDLSNITFVEGKTGWIIFDPLTSAETARAALKFINEKVGTRPVTAVIYSHSHGDHFAGVKGVTSEEDVKSGKTVIIAPIGFMHHAVSENVFAGNAMSRRLFYQYGVLLPVDPHGHVDQSIGKNVSAGTITLIPPTIVITKNVEELTVDGIKMVFQNTPGTEAPAEMNTYIPSKKAFWAAENVTGTIHNIYTLRGAQVRDALEWSKKINEALYLFGQEAEVMFASHSWPRWGNERIQEVMRDQRDLYANMNNSVLNLANKGVTINEIHNVYQVPESLQKKWHARSYHGSIEHNSRAIINRYLGYWDANPTTLVPLSPSESAPLYVEMMGGAAKIISKGRALYNSGDYLLATEILNKLVYAEHGNQEAKDLLADCFEQIGYQRESASVRNSFLAAAYELRNGIPTGASPKSASPDLLQALTVSMMLDFVGIRLNPERAAGKSFTINLILPDIKEKYVVELSNSTLSNIEGFTSPKADLTLTLNRKDINLVMGGVKTFEELIKGGQVKFEGNIGVLAELKGMLDNFELGFQIMPGTKKAKDAVKEKDVFELDEPEMKGDN
ncbi:MAG: MBL fold metallo-hydrolase [Cyclobacteriaceae bacterium]|nr:MBL fold metallo-hydrolase [Cyclobacteriaceae bacterium]